MPGRSYETFLNKLINLVSGFKTIDYLDQLNVTDQIKLRRLLLLELTAILDQNGYRCEKLMSKKGQNIQKNYNKLNNRDRKNQIKNLLFGVSLDELLRRDGERLDWPHRIPAILKFLIDYIRLHGLNQEGIFRIPASNSRIQSLSEELRKLYFSSPIGRSELLRSFLFELLKQFTIYDVIAVFKQLIRELPEPILDFKLQEIFLIVPNISNYSHKIQVLNFLILLLNSTNRCTLQEILALLKEVALNDKQNKMNIVNIATVISPNLFLNQITNEKQSKQISRTKNSCEVTKLIINYYDILFSIPDNILNQMHYIS